MDIQQRFPLPVESMRHGTCPWDAPLHRATVWSILPHNLRITKSPALNNILACQLNNRRRLTFPNVPDGHYVKSVPRHLSVWFMTGYETYPPGNPTRLSLLGLCLTPTDSKDWRSINVDSVSEGRGWPEEEISHKSFSDHFTDHWSLNVDCWWHCPMHAKSRPHFHTTDRATLKSLPFCYATAHFVPWSFASARLIVAH